MKPKRSLQRSNARMSEGADKRRFMTASEMQKKSAKKRWRKLTKRQRSEEMKRVAKCRWEKQKP